MEEKISPYTMSHGKCTTQLREKKEHTDTEKVLAFIFRTHNHFGNEFFANRVIKAERNPSNDNTNRCCWLLTTPIVPLTKPNHNICVCMYVLLLWRRESINHTLW